MTGVLPSPDMTADEFRAWYDRLKRIDPTLTHAKLAKRLDVDQPRIGKWLRGKENGGVAISGYLHLALERLEQLMIEERKPKRRGRSASRPPTAAPGGTSGEARD